MKISDLWDEVFYDYVPEKNRVKNIFDQESAWNKHLNKFSEECSKYDIDLIKQISKLGFKSEFEKPKYIQYMNEGVLIYSFHDKENNHLEIEKCTGVLTATYKGFEFKENSTGIIGDTERHVLAWLKGII